MHFTKIDLPIICSIILAVISSCSRIDYDYLPDNPTNIIQTKSVVEDDVISYYDYCYKNGFWDRFESLESKIKATQIPEDRIQKYSSLDLLIININNPLTSIFAAYNNELQAVDILADRLASFRCFEAREDAANVLLDFYSKVTIEPEQTNHCIPIDGKYSLSMLACNFLELYIASARVPEIFDEKNRLALISIADSLLEVKTTQPEFYSWFSWEKELLIIDEAKSDISMSRDKASDFYLRRHFGASIETKAYYDNYSTHNQHPITIYTLNGHPVSALRIEDLSNIEKNNVYLEFLSVFNGTLRGNERESVTATYNCHAYAWHITDNYPNPTICWINRSLFDISSDDNLSTYWTHDYYYRVNEADAVKIYYSTGDHSAIPADENGYYISKWGVGPLIKHTPANCPYLTDEMMYYAHTGLAYGEPSTDQPRPEEPGLDDPDSGIIGGIGLTIVGNTTAKVNRSYTYTIRNMFDSDEIQWSCVPINIGTNNVLISPSTGSTVDVMFYSPGRYELTASYTGTESANRYGRLIIKVNE